MFCWLCIGHKLWTNGVELLFFSSRLAIQNHEQIYVETHTQCLIALWFYISVDVCWFSSFYPLFYYSLILFVLLFHSLAKPWYLFTLFKVEVAESIQNILPCRAQRAFFGLVEMMDVQTFARSYSSTQRAKGTNPIFTMLEIQIRAYVNARAKKRNLITFRKCELFQQNFCIKFKQKSYCRSFGYSSQNIYLFFITATQSNLMTKFSAHTKYFNQIKLTENYKLFTLCESDKKRNKRNISIILFGRISVFRQFSCWFAVILFSNIREDVLHNFKLNRLSMGVNLHINCIIQYVFGKKNAE